MIRGLFPKPAREAGRGREAALCPQTGGVPSRGAGPARREFEAPRPSLLRGTRLRFKRGGGGERPRTAPHAPASERSRGPRSAATPRAERPSRGRGGRTAPSQQARSRAAALRYSAGYRAAARPSAERGCIAADAEYTAVGRRPSTSGDQTRTNKRAFRGVAPRTLWCERMRKERGYEICGLRRSGEERSDEPRCGVVDVRGDVVVVRGVEAADLRSEDVGHFFTGRGFCRRSVAVLKEPRLMRLTRLSRRS